MSYFSDTLSDLLVSHRMTSNEVCVALNMSKSNFSKVKNGTVLPNDFNLVEQIAQSMRLSSPEKSSLINAYKVTKYGGNYVSTEDTIKKLYGMQFSEESPHTRTNGSLPTENGTLVTGQETVLDLISNIARSARDTVRLLYVSNDVEICESIKKALICRNMSNDVEYRWFTYFDSTAEKFSKNLNIFVNSLEIVYRKNVSLHYNYTNLLDLLDCSLFPYMVSNGSSLLIFSSDLSQGIYFNSTDVVDTYEQKFDGLFEGGFNIFALTSAVGLGKIIDELDEFVNVNNYFDSKSCNNFYIIERHPCIFPTPKADVSSSELMSFINDDVKNYEFAVKYLNIVRKLHSNIKTMKCIFCEAGLKEYFELEEYYEFNNIINTRPISKYERNQYIKGMMDVYKQNPKLNMNMITKSLLDNTLIDCINIWEDGRLIIMFNLKTDYLICTLKEKSITDTLINYFEVLRDGKLILSNEETFKKISDYYQNYNK